MPKELDPLKNVRIASPCPASWDRMAGDDRVRHCTLCDLNVYNFAELAGDEVRTLLMKSEGRVCARMVRRADGTLLTKDCPAGARSLRRKFSRAASGFAAALLSVVALASGCASTDRTKSRSRVQLEVTPNADARAEAAFAGVVVVGQEGDPLPGATVTLRNEATGVEKTVVTDVNGAFSFASLTDGAYDVRMELAGFATARAQHVKLQRSGVTRARVTMQLEGLMGEVITVGAPAIDPLAEQAVTTTFSHDLIENLPH